MNKIKIGYLPLYIKLYDDSNPHYRDPMVKHMRTLISMLESEGLEVVAADVCRIRPEFEAAARLFNEQDVDAVVTQHLAYSPSLESIDALLSIKAPLIVLDTTPDYELLSIAGYRSGISNNHGIHGVQDMCNLLRQHGRSYEIWHRPRPAQPGHQRGCRPVPRGEGQKAVPDGARGHGGRLVQGHG